MQFSSPARQFAYGIFNLRGLARPQPARHTAPMGPSASAPSAGITMIRRLESAGLRYIRRGAAQREHTEVLRKPQSSVAASHLAGICNTPF